MVHGRSNRKRRIRLLVLGLVIAALAPLVGAHPASAAKPTAEQAVSESASASSSSSAVAAPSCRWSAEDRTGPRQSSDGVRPTSVSSAGPCDASRAG